MNQAVQHDLIERDDEDLLECLSQIRGMADKDATISLDGKGRPQSNKNNPAGNKKPAVVFREWAAMPDALPVVENLHRKLRDQEIWLWTGGDIDHHLGLTGAKKDMTTWAPLRRRLEQESYRDVIADTATIDVLVSWMGRLLPK
jgi:putative ATP-dependent endonuclease of OLD family